VWVICPSKSKSWLKELIKRVEKVEEIIRKNAKKKRWIGQAPTNPNLVVTEVQNNRIRFVLSLSDSQMKTCSGSSYFLGLSGGFAYVARWIGKFSGERILSDSTVVSFNQLIGTICCPRYYSQTVTDWLSEIDNWDCFEGRCWKCSSI